MGKKKKKIDSNLLIALGVLISSVAALFVYIKQANLMSKQTDIILEQTKAGAWPSLFIEVYRSQIDKTKFSEFEIRVVNKGTGPAIIEAVQLKYDNTEIKNWGEFYKQIKLPDSIDARHANSTLSNNIIPPNDRIPVINWAEDTELVSFIHNNANKLSLEICYKSVYSDHWQVKQIDFSLYSLNNQRTEIENCKINGVLFED